MPTSVGKVGKAAGRASSLPSAFLLFFSTLFLYSGPAGADYQQSYKQGLDAFDQKQWTEAAEFFEEAVRQRPEESDKREIARYGNRFVPYLPHYHLGVVLFELGDILGAAEALGESQRQGAITRVGGKLRKDFREKLERVQDVQSYRESTIAKEVAPVAQETEVADTAAVQRASRLLDTASQIDSLLDSGEVGEAARLIEAARTEYGPEPVLRELDQRLLALRNQEDERAIEGLLAEGRQSLLDGNLEKAEESARGVLQIRATDADGKELLGEIQNARNLEATIADAEREIARIAQLVGTLRELQNQDEYRYLFGRDSTLLRPLDDAASSFNIATAELRSARNVEEVETARQGAQSAESKLLGLRQQWDEALTRRRRQALERTDTLATQARDLIQTTTERSTVPDKVEAQVAQLQGLLSQRASLGDGNSLADLDSFAGRLRSGLNGLSSALGEIPPGPPEVLLAAARAYFQRDYEQTISLLDEASVTDDRTRLQTGLFRAAARYALFLLGEERDSDLLDLVIVDVRGCRDLDPDFRPNQSLFSPRFLALYQEAGRA